MTDLYETLGVEKNATRGQVRRAFRSKSKRAHPDAGGDRDAFQALVVARDVLTDDARRARYDASGKVDDGIDNTDGSAMNVLLAEVDRVFVAAQKRGWDIAGVDVIGDVRCGVQDKIAEARDVKKAKLRDAEKIEKFAKRFRAKKKGATNRIGRMLEESARNIRREAEGVDESLRVLERVLQIADEHAYDWDAGANQRQHVAQAGVGTMSMADVVRMAMGQGGPFGRFGT